MQNAPSVTYPVGRSASYAVTLLALGALGGCALAVASWSSWRASPSPMQWDRWLVGFVLWLAWVVVAGLRWKNQPQGQLKWDAQGAPAQLDGTPGVWFWMAQQVQDQKPEAVRLTSVFDGQSRVLLHLQLGHRSFGQWIWLERRADPTRWEDLRRALRAAR